MFESTRKEKKRKKTQTWKLLLEISIFLHKHCAFYSEFYTALVGKKAWVTGGRNYFLEHEVTASG